MLKVQTSFFATDEKGDEVLVAKGDEINEISDAGPAYTFHDGTEFVDPEGWNVSFKFTPSHKAWTDILTVDAVKLLKALEGTYG